MKFKLLFVMLLLVSVSAMAYQWGPAACRAQSLTDLPQEPALIYPWTDDPQPDTLRYCDDTGGWILNGPNNIWGATRFTPADSFELRAAYIQVANPQNNGSRGYVHVMNVSGSGSPTGASLASGQFQQPPNNAWVYVQFPTPLTFAGNQEFFIVYGPCPAGPISGGTEYWPAMDEAPTGTRNWLAMGSGQTPPASWQQCTYGDFMIMAGGEYINEFTDVEATNVFHSTKKYWIMPGSNITLKATIANVGMTAVTSYIGHWEAYDDENVSVFSSDGVYGPLNIGQSSSITANNVWQSPAVGRYTIKFYVDAPEDGNTSNDTTWMELFVSDLNDMPYTYVYENVGGSTSTTEWGVTFNLPQSPAHIDSFKVLMNETTAATFSVYLNDATGMPGSTAWTSALQVDSGWVTLRPNVNIFNTSFTVAYAGDGSMSSSLTGVNSADNDSMMTSVWTNNGGWAKMYSGDWPFIVYLDTTSALPPNPIIALNDTTIDFGTVGLGYTAYFDLVIYNQGGEEDLVITNIQFSAPAGLFGINGFTPNYHIEAQDSATFEVWFHPAAAQNYNYMMGIINNATATPLFAQVSGVGSLDVNGKNPGEVNTFSLAQNTPNPFNPTTNITYSIPTDSYVQVSVFNVMGEEITKLVDGKRSAGQHTLTFDASGLSSGIYFYQIKAGNFTEMKKMILMK
jgi:hypothetical protein